MYAGFCSRVFCQILIYYRVFVHAPAILYNFIYMEAASRNFTFIRYWEYSNLHYFTKYDKYPCKFPQVTSFSPSMSL